MFGAWTILEVLFHAKLNNQFFFHFFALDSQKQINNTLDHIHSVFIDMVMVFTSADSYYTCLANVDAT